MCHRRSPEGAPRLAFSPWRRSVDDAFPSLGRRLGSLPHPDCLCNRPPCDNSTSTCLSFATISSGLCFLCGIPGILQGLKASFMEGHFSWGRPDPAISGSLIEAVANVVVGYGIAVLVQALRSGERSRHFARQFETPRLQHGSATRRLSALT
jgi:hypothetical protein